LDIAKEDYEKAESLKK